MLYSHDQLYKHICIYTSACVQNHNNDTIKTSVTVLRKIYLSLYLKGLCVRGSWRPNRTATYWPPLYWPKQRFFPVLLGCSTGDLGAQAFWVLVFSTASYLQLVWSPTDWISCALSYIIVQRQPSSCGRLNFALIQPVHGQGYNILIFLDRMHLLFIQMHFLFWQTGRGGGQYATKVDRHLRILLQASVMYWISWWEIKTATWVQIFDEAVYIPHCFFHTSGNIWTQQFYLHNE